MRNILCLSVLLVGLVSPIRAADDHAAIIAATKSYVAANSPFTQVDVTVEQVAEDFARAKIMPENLKAADPAWVFLKKQDGRWIGIALGTSFTTEDYQQLGIPNALRIP